MLLEEQNTTQQDEERDEDVLARSVSEPNVFGVLITRHEAAFLRKAQAILHAREDAEDVVQETFTKIYINAGRFRKVEGAQFTSWAYKILLNTCFSHYRKLKRKRELSFNIPSDFYTLIPDLDSRSFEKQETTDYVASILTRLPKNLSRALTLHFLEGKSHKEIAAEENISVGAVKTRVYRAKKEFRNINSTVV